MGALQTFAYATTFKGQLFMSLISSRESLQCTSPAFPNFIKTGTPLSATVFTLSPQIKLHMERRALLKHLTLIIGGVSIAPELAAKALANPHRALQNVPADRAALLAEMADTIIPDTDTPGAKAARVQDYIAVIVEECFPPARRTAFWADLANADAQCLQTQGKSFVDCSPAQRTAFFTQLQTEAKTHRGDTPHFFITLKDLALNGYFTSEIGATQALNYDPIPGGWIPDMPIDENTKAWTPLF
jgi:Gluconate 2-dehydrogenase subunit 3